MKRRHFLATRLENLKSENGFQHALSYRLIISIGEQPFALSTSSLALYTRLLEYFHEYILNAADTPSEVCIEPLQPTEECPDLWEDEDAEFEVKDQQAIHRDFAAIIINGKVFAYISHEIDDAFHNLLRWHIPQLLLKKNAFLMHSAGVFKGDKGYIFFGQSGAGKSTCSRLIREADQQAELIGDDAVIIQMKNDDTAMLHSAPLGCGYSRTAPRNITVQLAGMFSIRQSSENKVEKITPSEGMASLLASSMITTFQENMDQRFELAQKFAKSTAGIHALHFTRSTHFWPLVQKESL